jgi:hypothetical protein
VDQLVFDELPNDAGHLVAVKFNDRMGNLDLRHVWLLIDLDAGGCPALKLHRSTLCCGVV